MRSLRGYPAWGDIWRLIARSAFTQLQHSFLLLAVCVIGMALTFLAPPLLSVQPDIGVRAFGLAAWALMALTYLPTLIYLSAAGLVGAAVAADGHLLSGGDHRFRAPASDGRGGEWKGRLQAQKQA